MQHLVALVSENSHLAPWISFGLILLAGVNIPISTDVILVLAAFLAATVIPELTPQLFISILLGSYFSAWISYWIGRKLGVKLLKIRYFAKILPRNRLNKLGAFYEKHGLLTLIVGRFIPFGFRNCLFITTGMSQSSFLKFIWKDGIACTLWVTISFFSFYELGHSYEVLLKKAKVLNLCIFVFFGVTVIATVWYKRYKKNRAKLEQIPLDAKPSE